MKILTCFAAYVCVLHAWQAVSTHACLLLGAVQLRLQLHHALAADTCTGTPDSACTPCLNPQGAGIGLLYLHSGSFAHHHIVLAVTSNIPCMLLVCAACPQHIPCSNRICCRQSSPSMNFLFLDGMLLVARHPRCSASGSAGRLSELILQEAATASVERKLKHCKASTEVDLQPSVPHLNSVMSVHCCRLSTN